MKAEITFDEISRLKSGTATLWHYGTAKVNGKEYDFSLMEIVDDNGSSFEVTWVDETPENHQETDRLVIERYEIESKEKAL
jgi:hypothetical protein